MDLRPYIKTKKQLSDGIELIRSKHLFYQPFILSDDIEVGEGQNLRDEYQGTQGIWDLNIHAPGQSFSHGVMPKDLAYFRRCNQEYRDIYNYLADVITARTGAPLEQTSFAEIGCNTGLNLFNLALRGAKSCHGYDWNDMQPVFNWLNDLLGTKVKFTRGTYDNLLHRFRGFDVPEVDVMINTVFTNHQCDPLQFLAYLCDRARKGVFLWALVHDQHPDACVVYPPEPPHAILDTGRSFPLNFYNGVMVSEKLLRASLKNLGFADVEEIKKFVPSEKWDRFQEGFRMYYARRTHDIKSAYWPLRAGHTKWQRLANWLSA